MDYTSIINLALITVVYSTFIAPNMAKLSKIKENILEIAFPQNVSDDNSSQKIKENSILLGKKLAQYSTKYDEIKNFLRYFYAIVAVLVIVQTYRLIFLGAFNTENILLTISTTIVIIILIYSVNTYISHPSTLRSFGWLTKGGIAPIYLKHMYDPFLLINLPTKNSKRHPENKIPISIRSDIGFTGFCYILTVESMDSRFLYYVSTGQAGKHHSPSNVVFDNGRQASEIRIASPKLNQGTYRLRLLFNGGFFTGTQPVYETIYEFNVDSNGSTEPASKKILLGDGSETKYYRFLLNKEKKLKGIEVSHIADRQAESLEVLLSIKNLGKATGQLKRGVTISDPNGQLDRAALNWKLSRLNRLKSRVLRIVKRKSSRPSSYRL